MTGRPLDGALVLDPGQVYNGPYCGVLLGFMGARVVKIEPPDDDLVRRRRLDREPCPFVLLNSNKESVVLIARGALVDVPHPRRGTVRVPTFGRASREACSATS